MLDEESENEGEGRANEKRGNGAGQIEEEEEEEEEASSSSAPGGELGPQAVAAEETIQTASGEAGVKRWGRTPLRTRPSRPGIFKKFQKCPI